MVKHSDDIWHLQFFTQRIVVFFFSFCLLKLLNLLLGCSTVNLCKMPLRHAWCLLLGKMFDLGWGPCLISSFDVWWCFSFSVKKIAWRKQKKKLHFFRYLSSLLIHFVNFQGIWEEISKLLLHPHLWLCNRSNRLLALYFTTVTEVIRENAENSFGTFVLLKPAKIFMIVISLCCQLKAQVTDDDVVNNLLTQNIAFAISSLPSSMQQNGSVEPHKLWSALEQHEQAQLLKAFQSLDPGKGRGIFLALISGMYGQNDNEQFKDPQNFLISYLLKRMGKLSLEMGAIQVGL